MNSLLMVLATARDKIRLVKSAGRRSNCCWDSGGSFDGEGNDRKNWKKFWQRGQFIQGKRKFIRAATFLLYGTVISRTLQKQYQMNKRNEGSKQKASTLAIS